METCGSVSLDYGKHCLITRRDKDDQSTGNNKKNIQLYQKLSNDKNIFNGDFGNGIADTGVNDKFIDK